MSAGAATAGRTARVMGLIGAGHGLSHFYTLVLPPLFPLLKGHFGVSYAALGLVISLLNLATAIAQVPAGVLVDRYGAKRLLILGMAASSLGVIGAALADNYWLLIAAMLVTGLGNAVFHPADYAIMNSAIRPDWMGRAFGIHTFTGNIGFAAAPPVILALATVADWRTALLIVGLAGIVVMALLMWQGEHLASEADMAPASAAAATEVPGGTLALYLSAPVILCLGFYVMLAMVTSGVQSFSVTALDAQGALDLGAANVALSTYLVSAMIGVLAGGWIADRSRNHTLFAVTGIALAAVLLLAAGLVPMPAVLVIAAMAVSGFFNGVIRPARDLIVRAAIPKSAIGRVFGLVSTGGWIGMAATPVMFGYALDVGRPDLVFWLSGAFMAAAIVTVITVSRRRAA
jgi:FSR family fosmidomycin resistance protein-like MFS transporter